MGAADRPRNASECRGKGTASAVPSRPWQEAGPWGRSLANSLTNSTTPFRNNGSPPVRPNLRDPHAHEHARHAQIIRERQIAIERAFIPRPAIHTLVVAAIRNGNPQVGDGAPEFVGKERALASGS